MVRPIRRPNWLLGQAETSSHYLRRQLGSEGIAPYESGRTNHAGTIGGGHERQWWADACRERRFFPVRRWPTPQPQRFAARCDQRVFQHAENASRRSYNQTESSSHYPSDSGSDESLDVTGRAEAGLGWLPSLSFRLLLFFRSVLRRAFRHYVNGALKARPCVRAQINIALGFYSLHR